MFVASFTFCALAQREQLSREQFALVQAKHISRALNLDEKRAAQLHETYCNYQKELWALGPRSSKTECVNTDPNAAAQSQIESQFDRSQKILDLRRKYYAEYSKFLSQSEIKRMYRIEKKMLNRFADRRASKPKRQTR